MPGYVFTLFVLGATQYDSWLSEAFAPSSAPARRCPTRARFGAVVFTLVLYPYVYLLARGAFLSQSRTLVEQAPALGLSQRPRVLRGRACRSRGRR